MNIFYAIILGALQGITEFLPVSSSGHLVLMESVLPLQIEPTLLQGFDIILHAGTALALCIVYWSVWKNILLSIFKPKSEGFLHAWKLVAATIPAAVIGILFKDTIEYWFRSPSAISIGFALTALLLLLRPKKASTGTVYRISWLQTFAMGCMQAIAIIPGLSRSGSTIAIGMQAGIEKRAAVDFSFQMALPVILGATILTIKDAIEGTVYLPAISICMAGFITSFVVSLLAVLWLRRFVSRYELSWFALYLIPLAALSSFL